MMYRTELVEGITVENVTANLKSGAAHAAPPILYAYSIARISSTSD